MTVYYPSSHGGEKAIDSVKRMTAYNLKTKQQRVVIYGDMFEGFQGIVGPFESEAQADCFVDEHDRGDWASVQIEASNS